MNEFKYVVKVKDPNALVKFKNATGVVLPKQLAVVLIDNNYGYPTKKTFESEKLTFSIKCLLSLNEDDEENIFDFYKYSREDVQEIGMDFVPFAIDDYGNLIAFVPETNIVIFVDEETLEVFNTKETIETFFNKLI